jgi:hypothetical protein
MIIYLYKKTHNITGLKYLGKTTQNPYKYNGSGEKWVPHLKIHGYDITTEILKECQTNDEVKFWGLYYSELWDVVNARDQAGNKIWANLKPEEGDGGRTTFGDNHPMKNPTHRSKISGDNHYTKKTGYSPLPHYSKSDEARDRVRKFMSGANNPMKNQTTVKKKSGENHHFRKVEILQRVLGEKHCRYDHTRHVWQNIESDELVELTQRELITRYNLQQGNVNKLISGKRKSHKGWKLVK